MTIFIGTAGGNKVLTDPKVGTASGRKNVDKIWVGTPNGNKLVYQRVATLALTATAVSSSQIDLSWTDLGPGWTYNLDSNPYGRLVTGAAGAAFSHTGVAAATHVAYRVDAFYGGAKQQEAHADATTPAAVTEQRMWQGNAVESATYNQAGGNRGIGECYYGYYSSVHGLQKSLARWEIPPEIRGCLSVDAVELSWWNLHHYLGSGGRVSVACHHFHGSLAANSFPGSTAPLRNPQQAGDPVVEWAAPRGGWVNGSDWFHVGWLHAADRPSVAEEIRTQNLAGFGLVALDSSQSRYGYARGAGGPIQMRVTYTVQVG